MKRHERKRLTEILAHCREREAICEDLATSGRNYGNSDCLIYDGKAAAYRDVINLLRDLVETPAKYLTGAEFVEALQATVAPRTDAEIEEWVNGLRGDERTVKP